MSKHPQTFLCPRWLSLACLLLAAVWSLSGCATEDSSTVNDYSAARSADDQEFEAGADSKPTAKTLYSLARIFAAQGKDSESEYVLQRIVREYPSFLPAYNDLAEVRLRQGRLDDAKNVLAAGLKLAPRDPVLLNNLGMCHVLANHYPAALETFTQAAAAAPQDTRYRANMAMALGMMGRYDEALTLYQQVMSPADAHYNLAVLAAARKDAGRAQAEQKKAEALSQMQ